VWAAAQAGEDGALILVPDPVDYIYRSERMRGVRNPFAFQIVGSSMSPALEHGDQVVINPALLVRPGVDCVFIQQQRDGTFLALVKRLLRQTADSWHVRQYDPRRDFDLAKKKWPRAHVVAEIRRGGL
jgi:phage repressor protein C with HTH and peptisase S24 domain